MNLLIDASNIQTGGGLTHLVEILRNANPNDFGFKRVILCSSDKVISVVENRPWLERYSHPYLNRGYFHRMLWSSLILRKLLESNNAFLFLIGSVKPGFRWPYATICQNLLPIELKELRRFGFSLTTLRLLLLRRFHLQAYRHARGVIFLTKYSFESLPNSTKRRVNSHRVIPHGINHDLFNAGFFRKKFERGEAFNLLYVSIINEYKHQDKVAEAVIALHKKGIRINLTLIGPSYPRSLRRLNKIINGNHATEFIHYLGSTPYGRMNEAYQDNHGFIFASSCESFGMILTEAMAVGIPIVCSERSSLPETMGDVPIYFNPEDIGSIEKSITSLVQDDEQRVRMTDKSLLRSKLFTWGKAANDTFDYLAFLAKERPTSTVIYHNQRSKEFQNKYLYKKSFMSRLDYWNLIIESKGKVGSSMDVGCGPGWMTDTLCRFSDKVVALDGSAEMIQRAKEHLERRSNVSCLLDQITPELFETEKFGNYDIIIMSSVLEYLDRGEAVLSSLGNLLLPTGDLVFSVPNSSSWFRRIEYLLYKYFGLPKYRGMIINTWTEEYTRKTVLDLGFKIKRLDFQGDVPFFSTLFFWLPDKYLKVMLVLTIGR